MKDILDKITSYNLFNYLLPGVLFVVVLDQLTQYSFIQENLVIGAFIYYFVGLVVSRVGSIIVEPLLKKIGFVSFADYKDFVIAAKNDPKIDALSEANNMYRTFVAMLLLLVILKGYEVLAFRLAISNETSFQLLVILLLAMFLFSYRKQTGYVVKRINSNKP